MTESITETITWPEGRIFVSIAMEERRLYVAVTSRLSGESRSVLIWQTTVERPDGKTLEECLEAALYRVARASAEGAFQAAWERPSPDSRPRRVP